MVQRVVLSKAAPVEDHVEVSVPRAREVQLQADLHLQLEDDAPAVDIVDGDRLARDRLDEDLHAAAEPKGCRQHWRGCGGGFAAS